MDQIELDVERTLVDHFLQEVMKSNPKATYGELMIRSALEQGAVSTLLLSESLNQRRIAFYCKDCKEEWEKTQALALGLLTHPLGLPKALGGQ